LILAVWKFLVLQDLKKVLLIIWCCISVLISVNSAYECDVQYHVQNISLFAAHHVKGSAAGIRTTSTTNTLCLGFWRIRPFRYIGNMSPCIPSLNFFSVIITPNYSLQFPVVLPFFRTLHWMALVMFQSHSMSQSINHTDIQKTNQFVLITSMQCFLNYIPWYMCSTRCK